MQPESRRRPGAVAIVASTLLAVASLTLFAAGGVLLWADGQKDDQGYVTTSTERFSTRTAALATENLDVDLDGLGSAVGDDTLGRVRLDVQPAGGEPVFAGIARSQDVAAYLRGTAHTIVRDVDTDPFRADYRDRPGDRRIAPPADQAIWDASSTGGPLDWKVRDGDWSVVVMNADGSPGVAASVEAGAELPILVPAGWTLIGGGALFLLIAGGVLYLSARRPVQRRPEEPNPLTPRSVASS
jgi:hypothetical protein